ncbi:MAG TPA: DoxX family protein [Gemmataceae bacterium]|nr:DoxX family protein [Gemmataceae bacterium]
MATISVQTQPDTQPLPVQAESITRYLVPIGRILFSAIFIMASFGHFSRPMIEHGAAHGVPFANILVPLSGLIALAGGLSVLLGCWTRLGASLLIVFLIPVTLTMHNFWAMADPAQAQTNQIMFIKNFSMIGGALIIAYFGAGPCSIDRWWERRRMGRIS